MAVVFSLMFAPLGGCGEAGDTANRAQRDGNTAGPTNNPEALIDVSAGETPPSNEEEVEELSYPSPMIESPQPELPHVQPQRLFVTAGVGPVFCDVYVTLDGRAPYEPVDDLVAELLTAVGATADKPPNWQAIVDDRPIRLGQFGAAAVATDADRRQAIRRYDENRDGLVQPEELRRFLLNGDWLTFSSSGAVANTSAREFATWQLLDANQDGVLSPDEIQAAPDRLRSRDEGADSAMTASEMTVRVSGNYSASQPVATAVPVAAMLSPRTDWEKLWGTIRDAFPNFREAESGGAARMNFLIAGLDKDHSGKLSSEELAGIAATPQDLATIAVFGTSQDSDAALPSIEIRPGMLSWSACVNRPGTPEAMLIAENQRFEWKVRENRSMDENRAATAAALFQKFDENHDQLLDRSETENASGPLESFEAVDLDGDDAISLKELETVLDRRRRIENARFHMTVTRPADPLFATLDADHDGQLGAREVSGAPARLLACDTFVDGLIHPEEIPCRTLVLIEHGKPTGSGSATGAATPWSAARSGPNWFERMDTNGDGDLAPSEFLGSAERFAEFDANHDGFIDATEAERAGEK